MKKGNNTISVFALIILFASFLFAPVNLVFADDTSSGTSAESDKDADKKKGKDKGKGKGKEGEEEPDCE